MKLGLPMLAIVLSLSAPSTVLACSCRMVVREGQASAAWSDRPRIFIGHALEVDETRTQSPRLTVRFVTESSWRGPMPDTVTLLVNSDAPCAEYTAGGRYLVLADVDPASTALVTAQCDYSWGVSGAGRKLAELGAPNWIAPRMGRRALDAHAVHLGESARPKSSADSLVIMVPSDEDIARFEIADWAGPPTRSGRLLYLAPGLYQFRITGADGTTSESYVSLRCERAPSERPCPVFRFFSMLR